MEQFEDCPVIAAVKDEEGLNACLGSEIGIVFVLYGDICTIPDIVRKLKKGRLLNKVFSAEIPAEVYEKIEEDFLAKK